ncbi:hypothetical protein pb186bvf_006517 [Paramecium bursaria]
MYKTSSHQYLVKKYGNKTNVCFNIEEILEQINDVFCMQCEQYIQQSQIDRHSLTCNGQIDQFEQVDNLQQKLNKCNQSINKIKKILKSYSADQQQIIQYLQMLWKCTQDIIVSIELQQIKDLIKDLILFNEFFENQQDIQIDQILSQILTILSKINQFAERKQKILEQNQPQVIDHLRESVATSLINEGALNGHKIIHDSQLNRYRNPFENLSNNVHQSLKNTFHSRQRPCLTPIQESCEGLYKSQITQEADKKSVFFKLASQLKQQYTHKPAVQQALIIGLYQRAVREEIPFHQYEQYLDQIYSGISILDLFDVYIYISFLFIEKQWKYFNQKKSDQNQQQKEYTKEKNIFN